MVRDIMNRFGEHFVRGFYQGLGIGAALWVLYQLLDIGVIVWLVQ